MSDIKTIHPEILYAERSSETEAEKNIIYFTISAPDVQDPKLEILPTEIKFSAKAGDASKGIPEKHYEFNLQLHSEIIPEETKRMQTSRAIVLVLRKKNMQAEYWPRLTKEKPNRNWIKTDFSKWVDEDEQDGAEALDAGMDDPTGGMGGMGGMPGMGGMGGMPGMDGGMGGMGGMDFSKLMAQMGGAGGMGGLGGMGGMPGMGDFGGDDEGSDEGDDVEEVDVTGEDKPEVEAGEGKGKGKAANLEEVE